MATGTVKFFNSQRRFGFIQQEIYRVDVARREVLLANGAALSYDVLVVATGATLIPEETEGLTGPGWMENVFTFYTPEGAEALAAALEAFDGGRVVVNFFDLPIKCPVAPLELCFLADWYFRERGIRDRVELTCGDPGLREVAKLGEHVGDERVGCLHPLDFSRRLADDHARSSLAVPRSRTAASCEAGRSMIAARSRATRSGG